MHIAIIGNGVSGVTAARHIRKLSDSHKITIISEESDYFFSRTAIMYVLMGHMPLENTEPYERFFWKKNRINLKRGRVESINYDHKKLIFKEDEELDYDVLIFAVGSKPNKFGWKGQDLDGVCGMYSQQDISYIQERMETTQRAVIVGGGLIGVEMAESFKANRKEVTFLVRENSFWNKVLPKGESEMVTKHIKDHHIDLRLEEELDEIIPDKEGKVKAIRTKNGEEIACEFVGLTAGVSPNISFLKNTTLDTDRGILVDAYFRTNIPDVYAIGDCAQFHYAPAKDRRNIEQVWYTGRMHGECVAQTICGNSTHYTPSHWFNSAKFFDIEYQTYGVVKANNNSDESSFYWEHSNGKKCIHIVYHSVDKRLIGINSFGIRLRHEVFEKWLNQKQNLAYVLENFHQANFDPEFYKTYESEIIALYNQEYPDDSIRSKRKKRLLDYFGL